MNHGATQLIKATPNSEEEAREDGLRPITEFFSVVRKRGRPKKTSVPFGTPGAVLEKRVEGQAQASLRAPPAPKKAKHAPSVKPAAKASRTNWGVGSALEKLTKAVRNWDARPPDEKSSADLKSFSRTSAQSSSASSASTSRQTSRSPPRSRPSRTRSRAMWTRSSKLRPCGPTKP